MRLFIVLAALALAAVSGCARQETYPISGEECSDGDPVLEMSSPPCL